MEVIITPDPVTGAAVVGDAVESLLARKPSAVIGLATGASPSPVYEEWARRHAGGRITFREARGFLLDEYIGLPPGHPQSYRAVIEREVIARLDFRPGAVVGPDGCTADVERACRAYEGEIAAAGGIDLQLLGVGADGHVGFNEPSSSLASRTRVKTLTSRTRRDNSQFFAGDPAAVPRHVITQGIATILEARALVLVAWGAGKAAVVARLVEGPVTAMVPASALQLHPNVTVVIDEPAAMELQLADYYREVFAGKPSPEHARSYE